MTTGNATSVSPLYGQSLSHKINNICIGTALEVKYSEMPVMKMKTMKTCHDKLIYSSHPVLPCYCVFTWMDIKLTMSCYWGNLSNIRAEDVGV